MLSSPVGVVTDLDGTVVFGGVADPRLAPFLRRAAGREDISVIVATSRAPRGMAEVLGDAVTCLEGSVCLNGALLRLGDKERRYPMGADHVRAVVDAAFRAGMPLSQSRGQGRCLQRSQISLRLQEQRRRRRASEGAAKIPKRNRASGTAWSTCGTTRMASGAPTRRRYRLRTYSR